MQVGGKVSDRCYIQVDHVDLALEGYVPGDLGIGRGDYLDLTICLDCGRVQDWEPVTDRDLTFLKDRE